MTHVRKKHGRRLEAFAILMLACAPVVSRAALGDRLASVEADRQRFAGTLTSRPAADGSVVHEIQTPVGCRVREFASVSGAVFAVAWDGPRLPDLRQLLGSHFDDYARAAQQRTSRRGPLILHLPGLVFESYGHPRGFQGRAYIPELLPDSVQPDAIR